MPSVGLGLARTLLGSWLGRLAIALAYLGVQGSGLECETVDKARPDWWWITATLVARAATAVAVRVYDRVQFAVEGVRVRNVPEDVPWVLVAEAENKSARPQVVETRHKFTQTEWCRVTVASQAPCTYTAVRKCLHPRFLPLPDKCHG